MNTITPTDKILDNFILFGVGNNEIAIELKYTKEILQFTQYPLENIPHSNPHLKGLLKLRENEIKTYDMRGFYGGSDATIDDEHLKETTTNDETCIVVLSEKKVKDASHDDNIVALIFDKAYRKISISGINNIEGIKDMDFIPDKKSSPFTKKIMSVNKETKKYIISFFDFERFFDFINEQ